MHTFSRFFMCNSKTTKFYKHIVKTIYFFIKTAMKKDIICQNPIIA